MISLAPRQRWSFPLFHRFVIRAPSGPLYDGASGHCVSFADFVRVLAEESAPNPNSRLG